MKTQNTVPMTCVVAAMMTVLATSAGAAPQRPGCDLFPDELESPRIKAHCEDHDRVYERNGCTIRSWLPRSGQPKQCAAANKRVFRKIAGELARKAVRRIVRPPKPAFVPRMRW